MLCFTKQVCRPSAEPADKLVGWLMKIFVYRIGLLKSAFMELKVNSLYRKKYSQTYLVLYTFI
jgi:hypothetical protein